MPECVIPFLLECAIPFLRECAIPFWPGPLAAQKGPGLRRTRPYGPSAGQPGTGPTKRGTFQMSHWPSEPAASLAQGWAGLGPQKLRAWLAKGLSSWGHGQIRP